MIAWFVLFGEPPNRKPDVSLTLQRAVVAAGDGGMIEMTDVARFDWERMYVFGSYSSGDYIRESLGFDWAFGDDELTSDALNLMVFVAADSVTGWVIINEGALEARVDFEWERSGLIEVERSMSAFGVRRSPEDTISGKPIFVLRPQQPIAQEVRP